jgi:transmembrane sensor
MDIAKFRRKLERYLKGTANETENAIVDAWYQSYQSAEQAELGKGEKEHIKNAIRQKINIATAIKPRFSISKYYRIAAGLLLVSGAVFSYRSVKKGIVAETYTTLQTKAGEVKQVMLPDSSVMWVNALSRVRIPSSFSGTIRNILLDEGEVFLKVKHDVSRPFRVKTKALQIQVLGTSFNVNAYSTLKRTNVAVATGKVAVSTQDKRLSFLTPGQQLIYNNTTKTFNKQKIKISESQSWKDGDTYLNQAGFDELALVVKNLFGVKLKAANLKVQNYQFTLRLQRNMPVTEALKIISLMHNTHFRREGDEVVLY